jgi:hypothetical protein
MMSTLCRESNEVNKLIQQAQKWEEKLSKSAKDNIYTNNNPQILL